VKSEGALVRSELLGVSVFGSEEEADTTAGERVKNEGAAAASAIQVSCGCAREPSRASGQENESENVQDHVRSIAATLNAPAKNSRVVRAVFHNSHLRVGFAAGASAPASGERAAGVLIHQPDADGEL
jgi:hypothetical protein